VKEMYPLQWPEGWPRTSLSDREVREADEATRLRREIAGLEQELADANAEAATAKTASADAISAIRALRKQTEPLYLALKMIHGEISRVDARAATPAAEEEDDQPAG
jgi:chromosome segregation ATPase